MIRTVDGVPGLVRPRNLVFRMLGIAALALTAVPAVAEEPIEVEELVVVRDAEEGAPVTPHIFNGDLSQLEFNSGWKPGDPIREIPRRRYFRPGQLDEIYVEPKVDPLVGRQMEQNSQRGSDPFTAATRNFAGIGFTGAGVPDVTGDVGFNHFIQSLNGGTAVRIWDKNLPNPNVLTTFNMDSLGGGACANGFGDPIVIFDREADRWLISEFASSGARLCVYISQTSDPVTGGWFNYQFDLSSFPDYPKYAVWPTDANGGDGSYVVTANDGGPGVIALDRGKMLQGQAATFQRLTIGGLPGFSFQSPTPADIDGPMRPEPRAEAMIMRHRDTESHSGPAAAGDLLEMWFFDVDWENSGNTSLSQQASIDVADFDSSLCGLTSFFCFPQPGTGTTLDPLREVIMNRLQYMNHGTHESLVGNFVVDLNGNNFGGIRWFELRRTGGPWSLFQEGTYSVDTDHRWMGASAMDQSGNIALAYNVSSGSTFPSLRYTGRKFNDAPGVMTQPETSIQAGTGSSGTNRYGDYAQMGLDPEDDCTFWFTGESNNPSTWQTRVASFRFQACGCLVAPAPLLAEAQPVGDNRIDVSWPDSELPTVVEYRIERSRNAGGPFEEIAVVSDSSPGVGDDLPYVFQDLDVSGSITYFYNVVGTDGLACSSEPTSTTSATATGACTLRPLFNGVQNATATLGTTCSVDLAWGTAVAECGPGTVFNVYRSTDPLFVPAPGNRVASGVSGSAVLDSANLSTNTEYFYVVRAVDISNGAEDLNDVKLSAIPGGPGSGENIILSEDFSNEAAFDNWTVTLGPGPHRCGEWELATGGTQRPSGGSGNFVTSISDSCIQLLPQTSASVDSPVINTALPNLTELYVSADIYYNHRNGDDATIEVFDGANWQVIWADSDVDENTRLTLDVTAFANPNFQVRFNYQNANDDLWFSFDNVEVLGIAVNTCLTVSSGPPSAPDGRNATQPLRGDRLTVAGDSLQVSWDAGTCTASDYNLLYGDLSGVSSYALNGSECSLGTSGNFTWNSVPGGSLFFLVVGDNESGVESSWGVDSSNGERNGATASGECAAAQKDTLNVCN